MKILNSKQILKAFRLSDVCNIPSDASWIECFYKSCCKWCCTLVTNDLDLCSGWPMQVFSIHYFPFVSKLSDLLPDESKRTFYHRFQSFISVTRSSLLYSLQDHDLALVYTVRFFCSVRQPSWPYMLALHKTSLVRSFFLCLWWECYP